MASLIQERPSDSIDVFSRQAGALERQGTDIFTEISRSVDSNLRFVEGHAQSER